MDEVVTRFLGVLSSDDVYVSWRDDGDGSPYNIVIDGHIDKDLLFTAIKAATGNEVKEN